MDTAAVGFHCIGVDCVVDCTAVGSHDLVGPDDTAVDCHDTAVGSQNFVADYHIVGYTSVGSCDYAAESHDPVGLNDTAVGSQYLVGFAVGLHASVAGSHNPVGSHDFAVGSHDLAGSFDIATGLHNSVAGYAVAGSSHYFVYWDNSIFDSVEEACAFVDSYQTVSGPCDAGVGSRDSADASCEHPVEDQKQHGSLNVAVAHQTRTEGSDG